MLILASQSATRKALLTGAGLIFESSPAPIDERAIEAGQLGKHPRALAQQLAGEKALAISRLNPAATVIGADQVLAFTSLLHKPTDLAEARSQLLLLRGKTHHLHAGVALARDGEILWAEVDTAALTMREFDEAELDAVLAKEGEAVLAAIGGYRLEGASINLFERIEGDYFTILGLPLVKLLAALRRYAPSERFT